MSKRIANKKGKPRPGKRYGRQRVRLGWRKRLLKIARIQAAIKHQLQLEEA